MQYVVLAGRAMQRRIEGVVGSAGSVVPARDLAEFLAGMRNPATVCAVVDPSLITPADAAAIVRQFASAPQAIVAYAPAVREAFESSIILAQGTTAQFVFQGMPSETPALNRALLLAPDANLGRMLTTALAPQMAALPPQLRVTVATMLHTGVGPLTADALAAQGGIARRSMDRAFELAGLESSRFLIAASRIVRVHRAVVSSRIPFRRVAAMAGYSTQRSLDHHFRTFLGNSTDAIRREPLSLEETARRILARLRTGESATASDAVIDEIESDMEDATENHTFTEC